VGAPTAREKHARKPGLFTAVLAAARLGGVHDARSILGAKIFSGPGRVFPVYLAGISYVRTAIWSVGIVGLALIVVEVFW